MKATKAELRRELKERDFIGHLMSNVLYNLKQRTYINPNDQQLMTDLYQQWDAIKRAE